MKRLARGGERERETERVPREEKEWKREGMKELEWRLVRMYRAIKPNFLGNF